MPDPGVRPSLVTFSDGDLHMDFTERMVIFDHRPASLRNRVILNKHESGVLAALVEHRGETLSAEQLGEMVWGETDEEAAKLVVKLVARLQRALGQMALSKCPIETVPEIGFRYQSLTRRARVQKPPARP